MRIRNTRQGRIIAGAMFLALILPGLAHAGGSSASITFGPDSAAVPTLGGTMLILLAMMLAFVAFLSLRQRAGGSLTSWLAGALVAGSLFSSVGGVHLISDARAVSGDFITNPGGQSFPLQEDQYHNYINDTGVPMKVIDITLPDPLCGGVPFPAAPDSCAVGDKVNAGDNCEVDLRCPTPG